MTPSGRQSEQQNKSDCGAGVIDMLALLHPFATQPRTRSHALQGGWRPFLLSFNLTFPANGQPGVNSTALIATRQSPPVPCERPRERGGEFTLPHPASLVPGKERFSTLLRVFFDSPQHSFPPLSATFFHCRLSDYCLKSTIRLMEVLISMF